MDLVIDKYRFRIAETDEELNNIFRFRYRLFCRELRLITSKEDEVETDEYDKYAAHFMCTDENNQVVASIRVVGSGKKGFPMEPDFPLSEYMKANGIKKGMEFSRLVVDRAISSEERMKILFGFFQCLVEYCQKAGVTHIYSITYPGLARKWALPGFRQIGEEFRYAKYKDNPYVVPMECDLQQAFEQYLKSPLNVSST